MKIINEADEKFKDKQGELCEFLFGMLREINVIERKIIERQDSISAKIPELTVAQIDAEWEALWEDYHKDYQHIVADRCTEKLLLKTYGMSINSNITYRWAEESYKDCTAVFQMSTPKKAVIEVRYSFGGLDYADRFTLIKSGEKWLVNAHNWWTAYDNVWHRGHI